MSTSYTYEQAYEFAEQAKARGDAMVILTVVANARAIAPHIRVVDLAKPDESGAAPQRGLPLGKPSWVSPDITLRDLFAEMKRVDGTRGPDSVSISQLESLPNMPRKRLVAPSRAPVKLSGKIHETGKIVTPGVTLHALEALEKQFRTEMVREYIYGGETGPVPVGVRFSRAFTPRQESLKGMVHKTVVADIKGHVEAPKAPTDPDAVLFAQVAAEPGSKVKIVP